jgi:DNA-binding SARP family transcriptional activator
VFDVMGMEFRALGPLVVSRNGQAIDIRSRKQRAVLALLLIHRNHVLTADRILDEIWGDDGDGKLNALRVHISRLRSALEPDHRRGESSVLETVGAGYRMNVEPDRFDVDVFERGVERGRTLLDGDPEGAHAELERALDWWRGAPYEEFEYDEFVQAEWRRLRDVRADALELRIEIDLRCGRAGSVLSELELLREQYPHREHFVEHQAKALYLSGRSSDALRSIDRHRRFIAEELGVEPSPSVLRLEEQILLHDERIRPRGADGEPGLAVSTNPYQGLRSFGTEDAARYFGRDALIAEILRNVRRGQRLVAVVGASGSGKSSLVRAGVVPALAKGAIEGSDRWVIATMVPGAHPFVELAGALGRATVEFAPDRTEGAIGDEHWLLGNAVRALPDESSRLVVVIDQFEELFTLVDDIDVRTAFLSNLVNALEDVHQRIIVVVALRADFYAQPLAHPEFGARLGAGVVNVTALTAEELGVAARLPAEQVEVTIEPALLGQLIGDVGSHPASLPLFQYALTELYDRQSFVQPVTAVERSLRTGLPRRWRNPQCGSHWRTCLLFR